MSEGQARALFARHFGASPAVVASAPGRVNLIGEHTDYNGGEVLPIAIEQRVYVAARARAGDLTHVISGTMPGRGAFAPAAPDRAGSWSDYVAGTALELALAGRRPVAADLAVWSAVPLGAGLSSSAALEVGSAMAMLAVSGQELPRRELATAAWRAEVEFVGMPCGIMDQFASALASAGEALHIWCDTRETESLPMHDAVLVFDTGVRRSLRDSAFATRRAECEAALALLQEGRPDLRTLAAADPAMVSEAGLPVVLERRARHVATENQRVQTAAAALRAGEPLPGHLLLASHESLRADFECSTPELDWVVDHAMREPGVRGARLTGAGWGGCAIAVGDAAALEEASARLGAEYVTQFNRQPRAWVTRAARGASVEDCAPAGPAVARGA